MENLFLFFVHVVGFIFVCFLSVLPPSVPLSVIQLTLLYTGCLGDVNYVSMGTNPDIVVLRINAYFVISMRYDLSFDNNRYTDLRDNLSRNRNYNKIYANPDFEIYVRSK